MTANTWTIEVPQAPREERYEVVVKDRRFPQGRVPQPEDWPHIATLASQHTPSAAQGEVVPVGYITRDMADHIVEKGTWHMTRLTMADVPVYLSTKQPPDRGYIPTNVMTSICKAMNITSPLVPVTLGEASRLMIDALHKSNAERDAATASQADTQRLFVNAVKARGETVAALAKAQKRIEELNNTIGDVCNVRNEAEREVRQTRMSLTRICTRLGCHDFTDKLALVDVVDKHLTPEVDLLAGLAAERQEAVTRAYAATARADAAEKRAGELGRELDMMRSIANDNLARAKGAEAGARSQSARLEALERFVAAFDAWWDARGFADVGRVVAARAALSPAASPAKTCDTCTDDKPIACRGCGADEPPPAPEVGEKPLDESKAYEWAAECMRPVQNAEPHKLQQVADKIVGALLSAQHLGMDIAKASTHPRAGQAVVEVALALNDAGLDMDLDPLWIELKRAVVAYRALSSPAPVRSARVWLDLIDDTPSNIYACKTPGTVEATVTWTAGEGGHE